MSARGGFRGRPYRGRGRGTGRGGRGGSFHRGGRGGNRHSNRQQNENDTRTDNTDGELEFEKNVRPYFTGNVSFEEHFKAQSTHGDKYAAAMAAMIKTGVEISQSKAGQNMQN